MTNALFDPRSEAMSLAHQLREEEGMNMSEALTEAWAEINYDEPDDLDERADEEEIILVEEAEKPNRQNKRNPKTGGMTGMVLLAGAGYLFWAWYTSARKGLPMNWTPWKSGTISRRLPSPMGLSPHRVGAQPFSHNSRIIVHQAQSPTEETISLLTP